MDQNGENARQFTLSGAIDDSNPVWYPEEDLILFSQVLGPGSPSKQLFGMRLEDARPAGRIQYHPRRRSPAISP